MAYLDYSVLDALDAQAFQGRKPYPWVNPEGSLTGEGRRALRETLPPVSQFEKRMGESRRHGQQSHDRYALEYRPGLELSPAWTDFMANFTPSVISPS